MAGDDRLALAFFSTKDTEETAPLWGMRRTAETDTSLGNDSGSAFAKPSLPAITGEVIWEQNWSDCILSPILDWSAHHRGAEGFVNPSDRVCDNPGRIRLPNQPSGTYATVYDDELGGNALEIVTNRAQWELDAKSSGKHNRDHTEIELYSKAYLQQGRFLERGRDYKLSMLRRFTSETWRIPNPQWNIVFQLHGVRDSKDVSRNPPLALSVTDGRLLIDIRADEREDSVDKKYTFSKTSIDIGPLMVDEWQLFEIEFRLDYREGGAKLRVAVNGEQRVDLTGIAIGYNDKRGPNMVMGTYHDYNSNSIVDSYSQRLGPIRFERY